MAPKRKGATSTRMDWADIGSAYPHLCLDYTTDAQHKSVVLRGGAAYIGRNTHLRLSFCEQVVSQTHALVEFDSKKRKWKIKDMGSSHGTEVNGKAVSSKRATFLKDGDNLILSEEVEMLVKVVQPDVDTVRCMLQQYAAVQDDIARFDLENQIVQEVDGWETCRDRMAEVLGEDDEDEEEDEESE